MVGQIDVHLPFLCNQKFLNAEDTPEGSTICRKSSTIESGSVAESILSVGNGFLADGGTVQTQAAAQGPRHKSKMRMIILK